MSNLEQLHLEILLFKSNLDIDVLDWFVFEYMERVSGKLFN